MKNNRDRDEVVHLVRHGEELELEKRWRRRGSLRARRLMDTTSVRAALPLELEDVAVERVPAGSDDSGEIEELEDGSISIPLFEEQLVLTRRIVLRERIVIRKEVVTDEVRVEEVLRRESIALEADDGVEIVDESVSARGVS